MHLGVSTTAQADDTQNISSNGDWTGYFSLKDGIFRDSVINGPNSNFSWKNNNGRVREFEFNWGNKQLVRLTGNINFDTNNQALNYSIGAILSNDSQFIIRQFTINDQLIYSGDSFWGIPNSTENINSSATELSYLLPLTKEMELMFTYGKSNMPIQVAVNDPGTAGSQRGLFVDAHPDFQYLTVGFRDPALKRLIAKGDSGFDWYLGHEMGFGLMQQTLSNNLYDASYGQSNRSRAASLGIAGQTGYDASLRMDLELGTAYLFKVGGRNSAASLGAFWNYTLPWMSGLFGINTTQTGYAWGLGSWSVYGIRGGVAIAF
jgi:hypothetical protein